MKLRITLDNTKRDACALTITALMVRLVCIWKAAWVSGDSASYLILAKNLAFHHAFSLNQGTGALLPSAERPPLYPSVIAALWWGEAAPVTAVLLMQAVLSAATVGLVYLIARDQFSRTTAILAGLGMVFGRMSCLYTAVILSETLFTFLLTLGVFLWGRKQTVPAGLVFGMAALTRVTILPFFVVLFLLPLLPMWRPKWRSYIAMGIVAVSVSSIWIVRNAIVLGRSIPIQESGFGQNVLFGTFETKTLWGQIWTGDKWTADQSAHPLAQVGQGLDGSRRERMRMRLAIGRIANDPLHWLVVRAQQYPRLFLDESIFYQNEPFRLMLRGMIFHLWSLTIIALAVFGVFVERAQFVSLSHITIFPIFLVLIHLPLWIEPRYTLPIMPMVAVLASVGSVRLLERLKAGRWS